MEHFLNPNLRKSTLQILFRQSIFVKRSTRSKGWTGAELSKSGLDPVKSGIMKLSSDLTRSGIRIYGTPLLALHCDKFHFVLGNIYFIKIILNNNIYRSTALNFSDKKRDKGNPFQIKHEKFSIA